MSEWTAEYFVRNLLRDAFVRLTQGGWALMAKTGAPNLVSGALTADAAWEKAARMLGWEKR
jgi:hypothetical protein